MKGVIISKHLKSRIKSRLGLPKRTHQRLIKQVLWEGVKLFTKEGIVNIYHNGFRYIFENRNDWLIGITVYEADELEDKLNKNFNYLFLE